MMLAAFVIAAALVQDPDGTGRGDRVWPGLAERQCGSELTVVTPLGDEAVFHPPGEYFAGFVTGSVQKGDTPRDAVDIGAVLAENGIGAVVLTDCNDRSVTVESGVDGRYWLVETGRGPLKLTHERTDGVYIDRLRMLKRIEWRR